MGYNTGNEGRAFSEYNNKQIAYCGGIAYLHQSGDQLSSVQEVHYMTYTEGQGADGYSALNVILFHHSE